MTSGGENPIRVQSMTTTDTMDTEGSVEQSIRMVEYGCELVRLTAPSKKDAENAIPMNLVNDGQNLTLRYRKSKNAPDGSFLAQASTELFTWNRDGVTDEIIENLGEAWLMETTVPINDSNRKFVRLSGELIEEEL